MGKTAISITLDSELLEQAKKKAEEDNRTLSNYIDLALKSYIADNTKVELNPSYEEALELEKRIKVCSYSEAETAIENSIKLSDAALLFAKSI